MRMMKITSIKATSNLSYNKLLLKNLLNDKETRRFARRPKIAVLALPPQEPLKSKNVLDEAIADFKKGISVGMSPEEIVSLQFGLGPSEMLTPAQRIYKKKIIKKLLERAEMTDFGGEQSNSEDFETGKKLYSRGEYRAATKLFEQAVDGAGKLSALGGEAQLWLALSYQALNEEEKSISLFKDLSNSHPSKSLRKQAENLLFIAEAPKLEISQEEKINIPTLSDLDKNLSRSGPMARRSYRPTKSKVKVEQSLEDKFWEEYKPKIYVPNRYVWFASFVLCACLAWYSAILKNY